MVILLRYSSTESLRDKHLHPRSADCRLQATKHFLSLPYGHPTHPHGTVPHTPFAIRDTLSRGGYNHHPSNSSKFSAFQDLSPHVSRLTQYPKSGTGESPGIAKEVLDFGRVVTNCARPIVDLQYIIDYGRMGRRLGPDFQYRGVRLAFPPCDRWDADDICRRSKLYFSSVR